MFLCLDTLINAESSVVFQIAQNSVFYAIFSYCVFPRLQKSERICKIMQTTIIDVKFDEKFKYELIIGSPCKAKPENSKKTRKNEDNLFRRMHGILKILRAQSTCNLLSFLEI